MYYIIALLVPLSLSLVSYYRQPILIAIVFALASSYLFMFPVLSIAAFFVLLCSYLAFEIEAHNYILTSVVRGILLACPFIMLGYEYAGYVLCAVAVTLGFVAHTMYGIKDFYYYFVIGLSLSAGSMLTFLYDRSIFLF